MMLKHFIVPIAAAVLILFSIITHQLTKVFNRNAVADIDFGNLTYINPIHFVFPSTECTTATENAFVYDLGGTNCACASHWDKEIYWKKVFSGWAFHLPHLSTPMQMQIIAQKWEWSLLWMCFNEIIEELQLGITGTWGFTYDPFQDMEPRYDSLLRDILICGVPAVVTGIYFKHVTQIRPFFNTPITMHGNVHAPNSWQRLLLAIIQFLTLERINLMYSVSMGSHHFYIENLTLIPANIVCVWLIYYSNIYSGIIAKNNSEDWWAHFHWSAMQVIIWLPSVYPVLDEIYLVYLSLGIICMYLTVVKTIKKMKTSRSTDLELTNFCEDKVSTQNKCTKNIDMIMAFFFSLFLIAIACSQPLKYNNPMRYTRLGCGQFWGKEGRLNGVGCKNMPN